MIDMAHLEEYPTSILSMASFVTIFICWKVVKLMLERYEVAGTKIQRIERPQEPAIEVEDYPELHIPPHPHVEVATSPSIPLTISNSIVPSSFDNEYASGQFLVFHPPTVDGVDKWCADYFKGKTRRWELRAHFKFKKPPTSDSNIFFAVELEEYVPMSAAIKRIQQMAVAAFNNVAGGVYHSPGDDPKIASGELEKPICALPLWAFDQFIVTPKGQEPPKLNDPSFPQYGSKRYKRVSEYIKEIEALRHSFDTEATFTFSTWGVSRFLDIINWDLVGLPFVTPIDFNKFAGKPPVYCCMYTLAPNSDGEDKDIRHINSRKQYYFKAAVWSSLHRPEKHKFDMLTGASNIAEPLVDGARSNSSKGLWHRAKGFVMGPLSCCTSRPQT